MTGAARSLFLALLLCAGTARALDLTVALVAQEPGDMPAAVAPGTGLAAVNADLAREICLRIGARCQLVYRPFGDILADVEAERVDLGFGNFLRTPERESRVALSDPSGARRRACWPRRQRSMTSPRDWATPSPSRRCATPASSPSPARSRAPTWSGPRPDAA